jgi:uncharacterized protein (TIGR02001 family)
MRAILAFGALAAIGTGGAFAQDAGISTTGNVAIVSDYQWRFLTQSNEDIALQGGLDWDTGAGFTFGAWASSVDFNDGDDTNVEVDLYAAYGWQLAGVDMKVGAIYYAYPDAGTADLGFYEVNFSAGKTWDSGLGLGGSLNWDPDNETVYLDAKVSYAITSNLKVDAGVGSYLEGYGEYVGWTVGGTYTTLFGFDLGLRWYENDIAGDDGNVVVSIARAM